MTKAVVSSLRIVLPGTWRSPFDDDDARASRVYAAAPASNIEGQEFLLRASIFCQRHQPPRAGDAKPTVAAARLRFSACRRHGRQGQHSRRSPIFGLTARQSQQVRPPRAVAGQSSIARRHRTSQLQRCQKYLTAFSTILCAKQPAGIGSRTSPADRGSERAILVGGSWPMPAPPRERSESRAMVALPLPSAK